MYGGSAHDWQHLDQMTTAIALKLMTANYLKFIKFYVILITDSMDNFLSISPFLNLGRYYAAFLLIQLCFFVYLFFKTQKSLFFAFILVTIIHFVNYGFIALGNTILVRLSFYTDVLQLVFLVIFLYYVIQWAFSKKLLIDKL
jgi:hypothetical protein